MPGARSRQCPDCGSWAVMVLQGTKRCSSCGWIDEPEEEKPKLIEPLTAIHHGRVITYKDHPFINSRALDYYSDYYDHSVGDIIRVAGPGGSDIFFELAAKVAQHRDGDSEEGYMLIRLDPEKVIERELDGWPVLDANPDDPEPEEDDGGEEEETESRPGDEEA